MKTTETTLARKVEWWCIKPEDESYSDFKIPVEIRNMIMCSPQSGDSIDLRNLEKSYWIECVRKTPFRNEEYSGLTIDPNLFNIDKVCSAKINKIVACGKSVYFILAEKDGEEVLFLLDGETLLQI